MTPAVGSLDFGLARADHHVEIVGEHRSDHAGGCGGFVGRIAIGHDVDVSVHIREHAADDMPLPLLADGTDDGTSRRSDGAAVVGAVVVENVDVGAGQRLRKVPHGLCDRLCLIVTRQENGDAQTGGNG